MDLDWRSIAGAVAPHAPKIGAVLGSAFGPLGGVIGGIAGNAVAGIFGVEATPEAVGKAIGADPKAVDKLERLEAERGQEIAAQAQVEIKRLEEQGLTARANVTEINASIREEVAKGVSWWHWRHLIGYVTVLWAFQFVAGTTMLMVWIAIYPNSAAAAIAATTNLITGVTPLFMVLAGLNGYVAYDSTSRVNTAVTGERPSSVLGTVKAIATGKR